jgi:hypothetical protein
VVFRKEKRMLRKQIAIAVGVIGLFVPASPATAATWGEYGQADPNVVTCRAGSMSVSAPYILPSRSVGSGVGGWQLTSYTSILKQWDSARRAWVAISESPPYFHKADWVFFDAEVFEYFYPGYGWRTGAGPSFRIGTRGYFTITLRFTWYDNVNWMGTNRVVGERDLLPAAVVDERSYPFERNLGYCLY